MASVNSVGVFKLDPNGDWLPVFHSRFELDLARGGNRTFRKAIRNSGNYFDMFDGFVGSENRAQDHDAARWTSWFAPKARYWLLEDLRLFVGFL